MYGSAQQSPYLQVALPLIEDVKGGEGLGSLWRVFTKCQSSIQDGSRLENISWRYVPPYPSTPLILYAASLGRKRRDGSDRRRRCVRAGERTTTLLGASVAPDRCAGWAASPPSSLLPSPAISSGLRSGPVMPSSSSLTHGAEGAGLRSEAPLGLLLELARPGGV